MGFGLQSSLGFCMGFSFETGGVLGSCFRSSFSLVKRSAASAPSAS